MDSDDAALLEDTVDEFLWAANYVTRHAFEREYVTTSKTTLHDDTYEDVRDETALHSNHVQAARNKAADACKSVVKKWKQRKKASMPHFTSPHVVYDHRTATFHDEYVSLATTDRRIEADYVLPDDEQDTPHAEYLFSGEYETTGRSYTTGTATGCFTSTTRRKWSLTRRSRQPPRTERFSGLTSA
ncbi:hypothetical protein PN411_13035 [Halorubrum ezzemoulense]|nr:hypothetical protein [Halorubrum ezzemoulense]MDB9252872.1 hypothetical protein [Halorubrum ezzemoulense]MDB9256745.1 hypothetical protein [Halorubrum ezzemoulense]MDB9277053.1 hypothetical protein [Halorubrum ezzemoulense]